MDSIFLVTHYEATHSIQKRVGGWYNSTLTSKGKEQASKLANFIQNKFEIEQIQSIYTSDLNRAYQTADIISKDLSLQPIKDSRLREMSFGSHEGMDQSEHMKLIIPVPENGNRMDHRICTGSESRRDIALRAYNFLEEIEARKGSHIVVSHGFFSTFLIAAFQKIEINSMGYLNYKLTPGSIIHLQNDNLFENKSISFLL